MHLSKRCGARTRRGISLNAGGSNNGSVDSLNGHQLSDPLARVKHTRLHGILWDAGDLGDLIDRVLLEVVLRAFQVFGASANGS
jgi:hypothetical protein